MTQVTWKTGKSGSWQTGSNWSNNVGPGSADDALITVGGTYTVTSSTFVQVNSVQLAAGATLDLTAGGFTLNAGTGSGANAGTIILENANALTIGGNVRNTGRINESSTGSTTDIHLNASISLSGGGRLTLSDNVNNRIFGNSAAFTLTNVDNTISGAGQLGVGQMGLINQAKGVINASGANALFLNTGANVVLNSGLIEDTGKGGLVIQGGTVIDGSGGGTISAVGATATVQLSNATIRGGTLKTSGGGVIETISGNGAFDGRASAVNNTGSVLVTNGTVLFLAGTINNTGTIRLSSTGSTTELQLSYPIATLTGGGAVILTNDSNNLIFGGGGAGYQLINVNNTISGAGQFGIGSLRLVNQTKGVVDANQSSALVMNMPVITNAGLLEATGTGGMTLVNTAVLNAGGTVAGKGAGAHVDLNNATIEGGTVSGTAGGVVQTISGGTLDGLDFGAVTVAGTFIVSNATSLQIGGVINNTGSIQESSIGNTTDIRLYAQTATLQGKGTVVLSDNANNRIFGNAAFFTLNNVNNTITGAGQLGAGQLQLVNTGTIRATGANALLVNLGSESGNNNAGGVMVGAGAGGLILQGGFFSNAGIVEATNGSFVTYQPGAFNLNNTNGTLTGGVWEAVATTKGATVSITGGAVVTDAARIILSGTGSVFQAGDGNTFTTLDTSLTTIAAGGNLTLQNGRVFTTANALTDSGTIALANGTIQAPSFSLGATGVLSGSGTVKGSVTDAGTVTASGGVLVLANNLSGTGKATIATKSTLEVDGRSTVSSVSFTTGGTGEVFAVKLPSTTTSTIANFGKGTAIDLLNTGVTSLTYASTGTNQGSLTIKAGTSTVATLKFLGTYTTKSFTFGSDGKNGTNISFTGLARSDLTAVGGLHVAPSYPTPVEPVAAGGNAALDTFSKELMALLAGSSHH